ncbi:MAG: 6,7-dimethyl-8-ribityllumazine synthase [Myxococcales bacterium]|nr:MAG: 6,7-dimethyl-8-ribityllumazine synthase [Myxococcales bacterium]
MTWKSTELALQSDQRFAVIASRFNESVVAHLIAGSLQAFAEQGIKQEALRIIRVPGAWEIPLAAQQLAKTNTTAGIVTLGAIIRGGTPHFEFVLDGLCAGLMQVMLETQVPISSGVLTTNTTEEAMARAGGEHGNKGYDAAMSLLEMSSVLRGVTEP